MKTGTMVALAAAGVAAGFLFGTKRGAAIRSDIVHKAGEFGNRLGRASRDAVDEVEELKNAVSRKVKGLSDDARKRVVEALDEGVNGAEKMKTKVKPGVA